MVVIANLPYSIIIQQRNAQPLPLNINITATPNDGGKILKQPVTVKTLNDDPLNVTINPYNGAYLGFVVYNLYSTANISSPTRNAWLVPGKLAPYVYPFNVPLIQTYSPNPDIFNPALTIRTKCGNKLIYLVVQRKLTNMLTPNLNVSSG